MSDLLEEIKEDLVREKYVLIWHKFGNYIIGVALVFLLATAVSVAFNNHMKSSRTAYSDMLFEAGTLPATDAIKKYDTLIADANGTYKALAGLNKAALLLRDSKKKEAIDVYRSVIETSSAPQELKDVAKLLYLSLSSNLGADSKQYQENADKYFNEAVEGRGIFRYSVMEIAAFKEMDGHNYNVAREIFTKLSEGADVPQNIKVRAFEMLGSLGNVTTQEKENITEKKHG